LFLGTPDRSSHRAAPKPIKTREEVLRAVIQSEEKIGDQNRAEVQHINLITNAQNEDDDDEMNIDNNVTTGETYVIGDKRRRATDDDVKTAADDEDTEMDELNLDNSVKRKKIVNLILSLCPWASIHGIYMIIDDEDFVTANESLTESFFNAYQASFNK